MLQTGDKITDNMHCIELWNFWKYLQILNRYECCAM